ncbi:hypothetical protein F4604DRAFT_1687563 [Suillus subluteus]|nr:hypothetical protein F4604DRAFT_1687563 [Suillus subluteus]
MPGPPSIESGSTGDTASGKLKKTAVVAALEVLRDAVAELERKGKLKKCLEKTIGKVNSIARGEAIFKYIQASGVEYSTTAAKASRAITDEDSLDRIHMTYQDLEKSLRSATLLDSSRSVTAPVDCIPAMTRDVKLTKEKPTGTYVSRCCAWAGDHRNESNSAVDTRIDPDPPKRHIIRVHKMVGSAIKSEVSFAQFDRRQWEGMERASGSKETIPAPKRVKHGKEQLAARKRVDLTQDGGE